MMISGTHLCVRLVPLFNQLPLANQRQIESLLVHHHYQRGEVILAPGDEGRMVIVEDGQVKLYQLNEEGEEQVLEVMHTGDYVGERWLYGAENEATFAVVQKPAALCTISYEDFTKLLAEYPELATRLLQLTMDKVQELTTQNQYLMMEAVEERLWAYLNRQATLRGRSRFTLPMKMKDLATYLGTTLETLSRKFKNLQAAGKIDRDRRVVSILQ